MRALLPTYLVQLILSIANPQLVFADSLSSSTTPVPTPSSGSSQTSSNQSRSEWTSLCPLTQNVSTLDPWAGIVCATHCPASTSSFLGGIRPGILNCTRSKEIQSTTAVAPISSMPPSTEPEERDNLLSFEEWKRIKEAEDADSRDDMDVDYADTDSVEDAVVSSPYHSDENNTSTKINLSEPVNVSSESVPSAHSSLSSSSFGSTGGVVSQSSNGPSWTSAPGPSASPMVHVLNRYNYASPDCSARVISFSPQTQHASSILHKSRDRYMLTPCRADQHWVVVELCDEIRVEAVEIAVWEFFSGIVREVRVSVSGDDGRESGATTEWKEVGEFVGKNVRGVQTFILPQPTSFHRFLRLDFPSHYGTEFYCPVSQLKVYGMNQMEAYKWEQRQLDQNPGKDKDKLREQREREKEREREREVEQQAKEREQRERDEQNEEERREKELGELERLVQEQARRVGRDVDNIFNDEEATVLSAVTPTLSSATATPAPNGDFLPSAPSDEAGAVVSSASISSLISNTSPSSSSSSSYQRIPPPRSDSSESIYAFIIRRLTALEGNSTLVARYIDEQGKALRAALVRAERRWDAAMAIAVDNDMTRWKTERMRQEERIGRVFSQMEQMRMSIENERRTMESQLRVLADELGYERRRSLAQLVIIIIIIVLGALTRGEAIDALLRPLVAEARRRRSIRMEHTSPVTSGRQLSPEYGLPRQKRLSTGPLAGLVIDIPDPLADRLHSPPALADMSELHTPGRVLSPTPKRGPVKSSSVWRPGTPTFHLRRRTPTSRSFSAAENHLPAGVTYNNDDLRYSVPHSPGTPSHRPPRTSLPPARGATRRLARSAHLHTISGDHRRRETSGDERETDEVRRASGGFISDGMEVIDVSTQSTEAATTLYPDPLPSDEHEESQWGTEDGLSASEVEDDVRMWPPAFSVRWDVALDGDRHEGSDKTANADVLHAQLI